MSKSTARTKLNIGERFGRLIVTAYLGPRIVMPEIRNETGKLLRSKNQKHLWQCQCDCGKIVEISSWELRKTKSCGCYRRELNFKGYKDITGWYWSSLRLGASSRGFEFSITLPQVWELFVHQKGKCALSGLQLCFGKTYKTKFEGTASLDRVDSTKGYTIDNIQWIHKDVNKLKMDLQQDYFIYLCTEIANNARNVKSQ